MIKITSIILSVIISIFSYSYIERPFRYNSWSINSKKIIFFGIIISLLSSWIIIFQLPKYSNIFNIKISNIFDIKKVPIDEPKIAKKECLSPEYIKKMNRPLEKCMGSKRTKKKTNKIYLIGDSKANQYITPLYENSINTNFQLNFVQMKYYYDNSKLDFPKSYISDEKNSNAIDFIKKDSIKNDVLVVAFHRGRLNKYRDRHISLDHKIELNKKSNNFIKYSISDFKFLTEKGVKILFIKDTPLMNSITTSETCYFQLLFIGKSTCTIDKDQDLHTRKRQDIVFDNLKDKLKNTYIFDPLDIIYKNRTSLDVIDEKNNYIMKDWMHISEYQSRLLINSLKKKIYTITKE